MSGSGLAEGPALCSSRVEKAARIKGPFLDTTMYVRCERRPGPWCSHTSQVPVCLFTGTAAAQVCFVVILVPLFLCIQAVHKKNLFPVQRVAKIEASRVAAILFFP